MKRLSPLALGLSLALSLPLQVGALERLDDTALSTVTGQAQGLVYTSEFGLDIQSIDYFDDDDGGSISLSNISIATPVNRPVDIKVEIGVDPLTPGRRGIFFENNDLPAEFRVENFYINDQSLGGIGTGNFKMDASDALVTRVYAGGRSGDGLSIDLEIPESMTMDQFYEDDGVRMTTTIDYGNPNGTGGMNLRDITLDIEEDGVVIGVPKITDGYMNFYNARIGDKVLNSMALRNINLLGGELYLKPAKDDGATGLEVDLSMTAGSNLNFVYISGAIDGTYPNQNVYELSGHVELNQLEVNGLTVDVDDENGLVLAFNQTFTAPYNSFNGVKADIEINNIHMYRSDIPVAAGSVGVGTLQANLNILPTSYVQIQGH